MTWHSAPPRWILPPCAVVGVQLELVVPFDRPVAKILAASKVWVVLTF